MRTLQLFICAAAGCAALAACSQKDAATAFSGSREISVQAGIGQMATRVSYQGDSSYFVPNDVISVYAWDEDSGSKSSVPAAENRVVDGVENTLAANGQWIPDKQMLWSRVGAKHFFIGIFPSREVQNFSEDPYKLDTTALGYEGSDLLIAQQFGEDGNGILPSQGKVSLKFTHAMAKLVVHLHFRDQWREIPEGSNVRTDTIPEVTFVRALARDTGVVNFYTKAITAVNAQEVRNVGLPFRSITPTTATEDNFYKVHFSGLMIPGQSFQKIIVHVAPVEGVSEGHGDYTYNHGSPISLAAGKVTHVYLTIGRDLIELDDEHEGGISIENWEDGETIANQDVPKPGL